ncbi:MAG: fructosamine kinase family protein [Gloeomargarita sp. SKYBB_i_bin120]|nr:fructosamine kinase family protein [Gloeomargarita sp. SKYG98]MCS7291611.1 fructosamine kinase family protein [Gloeomargarita sp. SKYB120]MDW8177171.1 fructosamine kinase family protein [Gloeomargarita sp. SKYBB_i_bin120]
MSALWPAVQRTITEATGQPFAGTPRGGVGGGCIHANHVLSDGQRQFFVKVNRASALAMFIAEADGLNALAATGTLKVPQVIGWGEVADQAYLVLEYLPLQRRGNWYQMGQRLAQLHRRGRGERYGWERDNYIGATPQKNHWHTDWATFFCSQRLAYQFQLAERRGGRFPQVNAFLERVHQLLSDVAVEPALVHGDLWAGNAAFTATGEPVIFDPAVYYGHREVDLAMSELFGGFPAEFYQGYQAEWPLAPGYTHRKVVYNLYHILNHFNLFGGSYHDQALAMMAHLQRLPLSGV